MEGAAREEERVFAEIAPSSGHADHPVCARGDVEKGSF